MSAVHVCGSIKTKFQVNLHTLELIIPEDAHILTLNSVNGSRVSRQKIGESEIKSLFVTKSALNDSSYLVALDTENELSIWKFFKESDHINYVNIFKIKQNALKSSATDLFLNHSNLKIEFVELIGYQESFESNLSLFLLSKIEAPSNSDVKKSAKSLYIIFKLQIKLFDESQDYNLRLVFYFSDNKTDNPVMCCSRSGSVVSCAFGNYLYIFFEDFKKLLNVKYEEKFSCITMNPVMKHMIATGTTSGKVQFWNLQNLFSMEENIFNSVQSKNFINNASLMNIELLQEKIEFFDSDAYNVQLQSKNLSVEPRAFHWHSHKVQSMSFSSDGRELISGGFEGVLVLWNVDQFEKRFLPRLNAPITNIVSISYNMVSVGLANNSIATFDTVKLEQISVYQSILCPLTLIDINGKSFDFISCPNNTFPLVNIFPVNQNLLILHGSYANPKRIGTNSDIQLYDIGKRKSLGVFSIKKQNYVLKDKFRNYQWLLQKDLDENNFLPNFQYILKFWKYNLTSDKEISAELINEIDSPHSQSIIHIFHFYLKNVLYFLTVSSEGSWKYWGQEKNYNFTLKQKCSYENFSCSDACISYDKSLLAIAHSTQISIWKIPETFGISESKESFLFSIQLPVDNDSPKNSAMFWSNNVYNSNGFVLLYKKAKTIWGWKINQYGSNLEFAISLKDSDNTVILPSIWGTSDFFLLNIQTNTVCNYKLSCENTEQIFCKEIFKDRYSTSNTKIIAVTLSGLACHPQIIYLDNKLNLFVFEVNKMLHKTKNEFETTEHLDLPKDKSLICSSVGHCSNKKLFDFWRSSFSFELKTISVYSKDLDPSKLFKLVLSSKVND